jgi:energy-coupling factor transporter transmembrane protein EcfT
MNMNEEKRRKLFVILRAVTYCSYAVYALFGILLIAIGSAAVHALNNYSVVYKVSIPSGLIVMGFFLLFIDILGAVGTAKKKIGFIIAYLILMLIIVICLFGIGIGAYALRNQIPNHLYSIWNSSSSNDKNNIQNDFYCCGWNSPSDNPGPNCNVTSNTTSSFKKILVVKISSQLGASSNTTYRYSQGCKDVLINDFNEQLTRTGAVGVVFATFQLLGIVLTAIVLHCIRTDPTTKRSYDNL